MTLFRSQEKLYLAFARSHGLLQLFEDKSDTRNPGRSFKLYKEWKHASFSNFDSIIALEFVSNRYLFTASSEGKLVFRDLLNDDHRNSHKVYVVHESILCIKIRPMSDNVFIVATAGRNAEVKFYKINITPSSTKEDFPESLMEFFKSPSQDEHFDSSPYLENTSDTQGLRLRRFSNSILRTNLFDRQVENLVPFWSASSAKSDYLYYTSPSNIVTNWTVSIVISNSDPKKIICGTQFGRILFYNTQRSTARQSVLNVSQFPIKCMELFSDDRLLLFCDALSNVGIMKMSNKKITNLYKNLNVGTVMYCQIVTNPNMNLYAKRMNDHDDVATFDPVYVLVTTMEMKFAIYRLHDDGKVDKIITIHSNLILTNFILLSLEGHYSQLNRAIASEEKEEDIFLHKDGPNKKLKKCNSFEVQKLSF